MKKLRTQRWILATAFLALSLIYLLLDKGPTRLQLAQQIQIIPSAIGVCLGAVLFWLIITIIYGRLYCSTACPIGTLTDIIARLRRFMPKRFQNYCYRRPRPIRYPLLVVYLISIVVGIAIVGAVADPWNMFRNIVGTVHPQASTPAIKLLGSGMGVGLAAGIITLLTVVIFSLFTGRGFCTSICPLGTLLSLAASNATWRVEIDPDKCINCMKCEEVCGAGCVKVVGRYVDDTRCVRCMECVAVCPNNAIRYQSSRNRRATPLMQHRKQSGSA